MYAGWGSEQRESGQPEIQRVSIWSGEIPSELGNLTELVRLYLHDNQLAGEIPSELSNLVNLKGLYLAGNQLSGCIPSGLEEVPANDLYDLGLEFCSDEN